MHYCTQVQLAIESQKAAEAAENKEIIHDSFLAMATRQALLEENIQEERVSTHMQ